MASRIVALVDMDCFYAQVEQRLNPDLKGQPVAVVQYKKWKGGGIIAVNYEARAFGVTRSMRGDEAKAKCPDIALVRVPENRDKADISKYRDAGKEVIDVLCQFSSCVERASIDEAYLDLTEATDNRMQTEHATPQLQKLPTTFIVGYESNDESDSIEEGRQGGVAAWLEEGKEQEQELRLACAAQLVEEMRAAVFMQTGFTCSAGIAHNKPLSKLVCGLHKPNRQTVLPQSRVAHLYATLPVRKMRSLGGKLGENLVATLGVSVMADLERFSEPELCQKLDQKHGSWLYNIARGIDHDPVTARLIPKSIGCCKRFPGRTALATKQEVEHWINELAKEVSERLNKDFEENRRQARGLTVQWSVKIGGSSCSKTGSLSCYEAVSVAAEAMHLLHKANNAPATSSNWKPPLQFLGIFVGKFSDEENKSTSIAKFFKPIDKNENSTQMLISSKKVTSESKNLKSNGTQSSSTDDNSKSIQNKAPSDLKSFFLNYNKKTENLNKSLEAEEEQEEILDRNISSSDEAKSDQEDLPKTPVTRDEVVLNGDNARGDTSLNMKSINLLAKSRDPQCASSSSELRDAECASSSLDKFSAGNSLPKPIDTECVRSNLLAKPRDLEYASSSGFGEEGDLSEEVPCPQCEALVSIAGMSEHLDHHVAQELHQQLNSAPTVTTTTPRVPSSSQAVKRKYTKAAATKNNSTKKTRGIDSFFTHK